MYYQMDSSIVFAKYSLFCFFFLFIFIIAAVSVSFFWYCAIHEFCYTSIFQTHYH